MRISPLCVLKDHDQYLFSRPEEEIMVSSLVVHAPLQWIEVIVLAKDIETV